MLRNMLQRIFCGFRACRGSKANKLHCLKSVFPTWIVPRPSIIFGLRNASTAPKSGNDTYYQSFFEYLKNVNERISSQRLSWPPLLLEFFGNRSNVAMENLSVIIQSIQELDKAFENQSEVEKLIAESASVKSQSERQDLLAIAEDEKNGIANEIKDLKREIVENLLQLLPGDQVSSEVALEVSAGVGGQEAMLFAAEVFEMYQSFCWNYGQDFEVVNLKKSEIGGYQNALAHIYFTDLKFCRMLLGESGVHRVQRVPMTERSGRIHTSTVSVAFLPVFKNEEMVIPEKDLEITRFNKMNSPGGQHANKTQSAVRVKHIPTGKIIECAITKSQHANHQYALALLKAKLSQERINEEESILVKARRQQVKNRERSDKIRTYNFHQDRITDHRIGFSLVNINKFMSGDALLLSLMEKLSEKAQFEELDACVKALLDEGKSVFSDSKP